MLNFGIAPVGSFYAVTEGSASGEPKMDNLPFTFSLFKVGQVRDIARGGAPKCL